MDLIEKINSDGILTDKEIAEQCIRIKQLKLEERYLDSIKYYDIDLRLKQISLELKNLNALDEKL